MINRSKTLAAGLLGATFLLGVAVGGVGLAAWGDNDDREPPERRERPSYSEILGRELSLTPTQRDSLEVILGRREEAMRQLWQDFGPRFDSLRVEIRNEIRGMLDSSQANKYEELILRGERRRGEGDRGSHGR
jgi:hypothetical protein